MILFLVFLLIPVIEIALFIQVGGVIGVWATIAIIFLTAAIGATVARAQGLSTLGELQSRLDAGADPREPMAHGALLLIAGLLLLTPGFMTDAIGFALLVPAVRAAAIRRIANHMTVHAAHHGSRRPHSGPTTVDGEYEVVDEGDPEKRGDSGWTRGPHSIDSQ
jgi:UPF0716 protein FxsA